MELLETSCSETTNTVSMATANSLETNKKIEHLLIKSKKNLMHFNRYYFASFIILVMDFFMTAFYSNLFAHFLNIFFFISFIIFAIISALKVRKGFNVIDVSLHRDTFKLIVFNALVAGLLILDLIYILASRVLTELNCVVSQNDCRISVKYFYECIIALFVFTIINCSMVFIFLIKFNKIRRNIKQTMLQNSINYIKPKELINENVKDMIDLEKISNN